MKVQTGPATHPGDIILRMLPTCLQQPINYAAIYGRVWSDQQKQDRTIASQTASLVAFASSEGYGVPDEWNFEDDGFSGATLVRPGLERVRDLVAEGQIQAVLVLSPDRLSRKYAYQVLLMEEWLRQGVQTAFVNAPQSSTPQDQRKRVANPH